MCATERGFINRSRILDVLYKKLCFHVNVEIWGSIFMPYIK